MGRERLELRARKQSSSSMPQLCVRQPALVHARGTVENKQTISSLITRGSQRIEHVTQTADNVGLSLKNARDNV